MNMRRFYLVLTSIIGGFLFITGVLGLNLITKGSSSLLPVDSPLAQVLSGYSAETEPFNTLVMVADRWSGCTDVMILVNYDPASGKINMLSLPRDTKVSINGRYAKINSAYSAGHEDGGNLACQTVSDLLNVKIKYYVHMNIETVKEIIDTLGGVKDYYVPVDMNYDDPTQNLHIHLKKGTQDLNGDKAEQLLRFRHPNGRYTKEMLKYYDGSDIKRVAVQQNFVKELVRQKANVYYLPQINNVINIMFNNTKTNINLNEALKITQYVGKVNSGAMQTFKLNGEDRMQDGVSYFIYDGNIVNVTSQETMDAETVISQYFSYNGELVAGENTITEKKPESSETPKTTSTKKKTSSTKKTTDVTKNNPSNSESNTKGSNTPKP